MNAEDITPSRCEHLLGFALRWGWVSSAASGRQFAELADGDITGIGIWETFGCLSGRASLRICVQTENVCLG
jgi:hypothetical protein